MQRKTQALLPALDTRTLNPNPEVKERVPMHVPEPLFLCLLVSVWKTQEHHRFTVKTLELP